MMCRKPFWKSLPTTVHTWSTTALADLAWKSSFGQQEDSVTLSYTAISEPWKMRHRCLLAPASYGVCICMPVTRFLILPGIPDWAFGRTGELLSGQSNLFLMVWPQNSLNQRSIGFLLDWKSMRRLMNTWAPTHRLVRSLFR